MRPHTAYKSQHGDALDAVRARPGEYWFVQTLMEIFAEQSKLPEAYPGELPLDLPEFKDVSAGIVLQAYLPDAHPVQREITRWARRRVDAGGAPVDVQCDIEGDEHPWSPH